MSKMEDVSDLNPDLSKLSMLTLSISENRLISELVEKVFKVHSSDESIRYLLIQRGSPQTKKIAIKKNDLFPLMIKLGPRNEIEKELTGYQLLEYKVNQTNLLVLEAYDIHSDEELGAIMYRYVTKGRVKEACRRFDTIVENETPESISRIILIIQTVFDSALKKCHFVDSGVNRLKQKQVAQIPQWRDIEIDIKNLPNSLSSRQVPEELISAYNEIVEQTRNILVPFGTIHGDLHPKNILIGQCDIPIIIDYGRAEKTQCIFQDYAKLEVHSIFQMSDEVSVSFYNRNLFQRHYSTELLVLPRSNSSLLSATIFEIRKTLWKNCMSNDISCKSEEIDKVYRAYLAYFFLKFFLRTGNSQKNRTNAYNAVINLYGGKFLERLYD